MPRKYQPKLIHSSRKSNSAYTPPKRQILHYFAKFGVKILTKHLNPSNKTIWLSAKEYVPLQWELANWFCPTNQ